MSQAVQSISDQQFGELVKRPGTALVDFWAPWCAPCRMQAPVLDEVAAELGTTATIAKVNVDQNRYYAGQLGIQAIPTLLLLKDGREIGRFTGVQEKRTLVEALQRAAAV